ncbi:MAG: hypothetical protein DHS20C05_05520 [Hyphococcus sp.]|nr:MAG: hypothetical protein DHS20C05_05520 [Marinicaulis sp.]
MNSLRTLAFIVIGAVLISAAYAFSARDNNHGNSFDDDDGRTVRQTFIGDKGEFLFRDENRKIKAEWNGEFSLDEAGSSVGDLDDELEITLQENGVKERIEFEDRRSGIEVTYYRDGEEQDASEETDAAIAAGFLKFLRASGMKADERVSIILARGGNAAVLEEISVLEGGHALRAYTDAFTVQANLTAADIISLTEKLSVIESDHDLSGALETILENETLSEEAAVALINAAQSIDNDHELRQLIEAFANRPINEEAMNLVMTLFERIESDHDLRVAAQTLFENDRLNAAQTEKLLDAAADNIESDHDLRLVLTESADMILESEALSQAWFNAYEHISSDHDQRLALEAIAEKISDNEVLLAAYRKAANEITSDYDREKALGYIDED